MKLARVARTLLLVFPIGGCVGIGPPALDRDHLDYGHAITETQKQQTLMNVVRLRYADIPTFVVVNQIVANHSLQSTGTAGVNAFPNYSPNTFGILTGSVEFSDNPTITFSPVTGARLAGSLVRPLAPRELFPLAQNGLPIDVLLRLGVQSIGRLQNTGRLENSYVAPGSQTGGSPAYFKLLADLRSLQDAGGLSFRFLNSKDGLRVYMSISDLTDPALARVAAAARSSLGMGRGEVEIVYGRTASQPNQIAILTRSFMGVLAHVSSQIDVPAADVAARRTLSSIGSNGQKEKPVIVVRTGTTKPANAFATVTYRGRWFWVADTDFDSKVAFSVLQLLMAIAQGEAETATVPTLTISTGP